MTARGMIRDVLEASWHNPDPSFAAVGPSKPSAESEAVRNAMLAGATMGADLAERNLWEGEVGSAVFRQFLSRLDLTGWDDIPGIVDLFKSYGVSLKIRSSSIYAYFSDKCADLEPHAVGSGHRDCSTSAA